MNMLKKQEKIQSHMIITVIACLFAFPILANADEVKLVPGDAALKAKFGYSVSNSGDYAIVGATEDDENGPDSGAAYIFKQEGTSWNEMVKLTASDGSDEDYFGCSVSISGDYAIVGAHKDDDNGTDSGSAYIYHFNGASWVQQAKITADDGEYGDYFGYSVSISGDYVVAGAFQRWEKSYHSGAAYIFKRDGASWVQQAKLFPTDGASQDFFGYSVSISGEFVIAGAWGDDIGTMNAGSAYIYRRNGESWSQQNKLYLGNRRRGDDFGYSVSISGDCAIIGVPGDSRNGFYSGSAYIFRFGPFWTRQEAKLTASDFADSDRFGNYVSLSGNYAIAASPYDGDNGSESGSAYIFKRDETSWSQVEKITASDGAEYDRFGYSVSIADGYAIAGAIWGDESGSAYIYDLELSDAEISDPVNGSTLDSASVTFTWNDTGADQYSLWIGTSEGSNDIYSGDQGVNISKTVSGLPSRGEIIYVRLRSMVNGEWLINDYVYTACNMTAMIQSPITESSLSTTETFTWNNSGASQYWLWIGTSNGGHDVYSGDQGTNTTVTVTDLPGNGQTLYVRLWSVVNGEWRYNDYIYTDPAAIQSPAPGSKLSSTTVTFTWNDVGSAYVLWVGSFPGDYDIYWGSNTTNTSETVSGLPDNGKRLYVRLCSFVNGKWLYSNYTYTATIDMRAQMQSPTPGSVLSSSSETFTWNDSGVSQYWLWVGTSAEGHDVYSGDQGTDTSETVSDLPANGETLYVRLWSVADGDWLHNDYTYTACSLSAGMQSPTPGSALDSASVTFTWNDPGASKYWLWVGT
ncbi:MAG: hypothetical protein GY749_10465 [Desulfobacteraceae bacterium]|nr:hypothetical protein [Desulfobacteraceae bacterium]